MSERYELIRVWRDGSQTLLYSTTEKWEIDFLLESPQFVGTWITPTRKLLRYGLGEIRLRIIDTTPRVTDVETVVEDSTFKVKFTLANHEVKLVVVTSSKIFIYDEPLEPPLFVLYGFSDLSELIGKDLAYEILQAYDSKLEELGIKGAV